MVIQGPAQPHPETPSRHSKRKSIPVLVSMPRKTKAQRARHQNINFARKNRIIIEELANRDVDTLDARDVEMTADPSRNRCEEPVCGSEDPETWDDEFENYGEGILGGIESWGWLKDKSDSEYDPEDSPESETESEVGLEDFDEEGEIRKEAELFAFSEALRQAQVDAVALEKAQTTKRCRGKSTRKSLSTLNRIARANAQLAKSGQQCISSFFVGTWRKQTVADNPDENIETASSVETETELDDKMTEAQVSTFLVSE
jgi:hypothetical protein